MTLTTLKYIRLIGRALILFFWSVTLIRAEKLETHAEVYGDPSSSRIPIEIEFAWEFSNSSRTSNYRWDFKWKAFEDGHNYELTEPPVIQWEAYLEDRKIGYFRDRFKGMLPTFPSVWGRGELQHGNQLLDRFSESPDFLHSSSFVVLKLQAENATYYSHVGEITGELSEKKLSEIRSEAQQAIFNDKQFDQKELRSLGNVEFAENLEVTKHSSYQEAEAFLRAVFRTENIPSISQSLPVFWNHQPGDPLEDQIKKAVGSTLQFLNPSVHEFKLRIQGEQPIEKNKLAAEVNKEPAANLRLLDFNFDRVWEREADQQAQTFDLEAFQRENSVEESLFTARRLLNEGRYEAALGALKSADQVGEALPQDFWFLKGKAHLEAGLKEEAASNLIRYARSVNDRSFYFDDALKLLQELESSGGLESLPRQDRNYFQSIMENSPLHFADLETIGKYNVKSPTELGIEAERNLFEPGIWIVAQYTVSPNIEYEEKTLTLGVTYDSDLRSESEKREDRRRALEYQRRKEEERRIREEKNAHNRKVFESVTSAHNALTTPFKVQFLPGEGKLTSNQESQLKEKIRAELFTDIILPNREEYSQYIYHSIFKEEEEANDYIKDTLQQMKRLERDIIVIDVGYPSFE